MNDRFCSISVTALETIHGGNDADRARWGDIGAKAGNIATDAAAIGLTALKPAAAVPIALGHSVLKETGASAAAGRWVGEKAYDAKQSLQGMGDGLQLLYGKK